MVTSGASRSLVLGAAAVLALGVLAGCGGGSGGGTDRTVPPGIAEPSRSPSQEPEGPDVGPDDAPEDDEPAACAEVRAGIDDFNLGDFEGTVDHFVEAVPIAEESDEADGTRATSELLEAVVYYAELAPEDYLEASATSPDFQRYKAITLGQCVAPAPPGAPGQPAEPGVPV